MTIVPALYQSDMSSLDTILAVPCVITIKHRRLEMLQ